MKSKKKDEKDEHTVFEKIIENAILFALACVAVKYGVMQLLSVRVPLLVIAVSIGIVVVVYRTQKWRDRHDDY